MEAAVLKYPDLFNIVFFKVRAELVKMGKISIVKNLTWWPKMKQTGLFSEYLGNQISDFQMFFFFWKLRSIRIFWIQNHFCAIKGRWDTCETKLVSWLGDVVNTQIIWFRATTAFENDQDKKQFEI